MAGSTAVPEDTANRSRKQVFDADTLPRELLKNPEFQDLGYVIVKHAVDRPHHRQAPKTEPKEDVMRIRVTRKPFTSRFTASLFDPKTGRLYTGAEVSSLGGEVETRLAKVVVKRVLEANGKAKAKI